MAAEVLQEFLVALGWKVDTNGEQKFKSAVTSAATQANLLSAAIEETAKAVSKYLSDIVRSFDTLYFVSQRTGASIQNIKGLSYAFEQVGSSGGQAVGALESFSQAMRTNPGVGGFVQSLGVVTTVGGKARDSLDVLNDAIERIKKTNPYATGAQYASLLGISESQFYTFSRYGKELKEAQEEHRRITKAFGLNNEEAGKSAARFSNALRTANTIVSTAFDKLGSIALPVLERMVGGIRSWVESHPEQIERVFRAISDAGQMAATAFWAVVNSVKAWIDAHPQEVEAVMSAIAKASELASKAFGYLYDQGSALFGFLSTKAEEMNRDGSFLKMWEKVAGAFERTVTAIKTVLRWLNELDRATDTGAGLNAIRRFLGWTEGKTSGFADAGVAALGRIDRATDTGVGVPSDRASPEGGPLEKREGLFTRAKRAIKRRTGIGADKTNYNFTGENAEVLRQAAKELGTSPEDLATVISYESKFSPKVHGGKGNRYQGLIQFGAPERAQFGASDQQSFKEQMPAVVRYLKTRGFKPGMGLLDLYSTINAGSPGHYNASDGNGTVRSHVDKMRRQEAANVQKFLGSPPAVTPPEAPRPEQLASPAGPAPTSRPEPSATAPNASPNVTSEANRAKTKLPPVNMTPGGFDVNKLTAAPPMGVASNNNTTTNSNAVHQTNHVSVKIEGSKDPQRQADQFERSVARTNQLHLENAQASVR